MADNGVISIKTQIVRGDVFMFGDGRIEFSVISTPTNDSNVYLVKAFPSGDEVTIDGGAFMSYVNENGLMKLPSEKELAVSLSKNVLLKRGERYHVNGVLKYVIDSDEMKYFGEKNSVVVVISEFVTDEITEVYVTDSDKAKAVIFNICDEYKEKRIEFNLEHEEQIVTTNIAGGNNE